MEERADLPVANDAGEPPKSLPLQPPTPPTSEKSATYIVKIPRDQIYRVPPPENSKIAESYRNPPDQQKRKCGRGWLCWAVTIMILVLLSIGVGIMLWLFNAFFKPKAPTFTITEFIVKNSMTSPSTHPSASYEVLLKIYNPNERMSVSYEDGGTTSISYEEKAIGEGKYPVTSQEAKESTNVHVTQSGSKTVLPTEVEKSMKDKEAKMPVSLSLAIDVPIKLKGGGKSLSRDLKVLCDFTVNTLAIGTKISSQDCNSGFKA